MQLKIVLFDFVFNSFANFIYQLKISIFVWMVSLTEHNKWLNRNMIALNRMQMLDLTHTQTHTKTLRMNRRRRSMRAKQKIKIRMRIEYNMWIR